MAGRLLIYRSGTDMNVLFGSSREERYVALDFVRRVSDPIDDYVELQSPQCCANILRFLNVRSHTVTTDYLLITRAPIKQIQVDAFAGRLPAYSQADSSSASNK